MPRGVKRKEVLLTKLQREHVEAHRAMDGFAPVVDGDGNPLSVGERVRLLLEVAGLVSARVPKRRG